MYSRAADALTYGEKLGWGQSRLLPEQMARGIEVGVMIRIGGRGRGQAM